MLSLALVARRCSFQEESQELALRCVSCSLPYFVSPAKDAKFVCSPSRVFTNCDCVYGFGGLCINLWSGNLVRMSSHFELNPPR